MRIGRGFTSKNMVKQLNKANIYYATTRDPFYEPYLLSPRFGVSGFNIRDYITSYWFKGDLEATNWFLSWVFYRTIVRRVLKRIIHFSALGLIGYLLITQVLFNDLNIFVKVVGFVFFSITMLLYYGFTSTPIYAIRKSVENQSSGLFQPEDRDVFLTNFFPQMPSSCFTTEKFIMLASVEDENLVETLALLHPEWFGSSKDLLVCAKTLLS